jgi:hypothetical protein
MKTVHSFETTAKYNPVMQCTNPVVLNPQFVVLWDNMNQNSVCPIVEATNINYQRLGNIF